MIKAILLDIEGTTSPISFVTETLFPYALARLHDYVVAHFEEPSFRRIISGLFHEYEHEKDEDIPQWPAPEDCEGAVAYLEWLMSKDRKSTGLKAVQGLIWEQGFSAGELKGEFFEDVPPALERWVKEGKKIYIFSSGSVLAQKQVFGFSRFGDLTKFLSGHFDTEIGPKKESVSYLTIASSLELAPKEMLFVSDVPDELAAAKTVGMQTRLAKRPGNKEVGHTVHEVVRSFEEL